MEKIISQLALQRKFVAFMVYEMSYPQESSTETHTKFEKKRTSTLQERNKKVKNVKVIRLFFYLENSYSLRQNSMSSLMSFSDQQAPLPNTNYFL